jgi:adenine-specific DNA-methyltransferase
METITYLTGQDEEHGEVFTRRWVVELILDLVGYSAEHDLARRIALEPACGHGAFLVPLIERLLESARRHGVDVSELGGAVVALDLREENVAASRDAARAVLQASGVERDLAVDLATRWIQQRDFLLDSPPEASVDFVVGNPPYIRLEAVAPERSAAYRRACTTMGGRADVYIGFYEHGLLALRECGRLGFICADRWMRNAYGARLREMVASGWSVDALISMTGVDAFEEEVDAYPAITVLSRQAQNHGPLIVETKPEFGEPDAGEVARLGQLAEVEPRSTSRYRVARLHHWFEGQSGWPHGSPEQLQLIADLEAEFPALEDPISGTKVGIGVATGADRIFVVSSEDLVEHERLLPLALPRDIATGKIVWSGRYLVNPWDADGLVDLGQWPRLAAYLGSHEPLLSRRHTAKSGRWYRTIDRVIEGLVDRPKLYLPDFKEAIFPVLDSGSTYPHHNLYWVSSEGWDLRVLGGLLLSDVSNLFIEAYSVRMRGGFLRFQAQYLRRIRVPRHEAVDSETAAALAAAFDARDRVEATRLSLRLFGLSELPA